MKIVQIPGAGISSNIYLLIGKKIAIIDAGIYEIATDTMEAIIEFAQKADYLILTHRHVDHIGAAEVIKDEFGTRVFAGSMDTEAIRRGDMLSTGAREFGLSVFPVDVEPLKEGDTINLGGFRLKVMETPGHTAGSISLYGDGGELFSGDTIFANGGIGRWDLPTGDFSRLKSSIERLSKLDVTSLYPGHGPCVRGEGHIHVMLAKESIVYY